MKPRGGLKAETLIDPLRREVARVGTQELRVRMALGADSRRILRMVLRQDRSWPA